MPANSTKEEMWRADSEASVAMYNHWFTNFAPNAFKETRKKVSSNVLTVIKESNCLRSLSPEILVNDPSAIKTLRMATCPPIAVDRLVGLAGVSKNLVKNLEEGKLPPRMNNAELLNQLSDICKLISAMADRELFGLDSESLDDDDISRAASIVADRLSLADANPIIRNAQEQRQLLAIGNWLNKKGYRREESPPNHPSQFSKGTYSFRSNLYIDQNGRGVNIPIDTVVQPFHGNKTILIEAKSAGDFTNTNKRRKEEATKKRQIDDTFGEKTIFVLFLCGYFDEGYLGYEAAEGIDWVWEHRIEDLGMILDQDDV